MARGKVYVVCLLAVVSINPLGKREANETIASNTKKVRHPPFFRSILVPCLKSRVQENVFSMGKSSAMHQETIILDDYPYVNVSLSLVLGTAITPDLTIL